jgi:hypothetical protein
MIRPLAPIIGRLCAYAVITGFAGGALGAGSASAVGRSPLALDFSIAFGVVTGVLLHPVVLWATRGHLSIRAFCAMFLPVLAFSLAVSSAEHLLLGAALTIGAFLAQAFLVRGILRGPTLEGACPRCGYALGASGSLRCSECGLDSASAPSSRPRGLQSLMFLGIPLVGLVVCILLSRPTARDLSAAGLRRSLASDDMMVQHEAVMALAARQIGEITPLLEDRHPKVRANAVRSIRLGEKIGTWSILERMLVDPDPFVRYEAALAIEDAATAADFERVVAARVAARDAAVLEVLKRAERVLANRATR